MSIMSIDIPYKQLMARMNYIVKHWLVCMRLWNVWNKYVSNEVICSMISYCNQEQHLFFIWPFFYLACTYYDLIVLCIYRELFQLNRWYLYFLKNPFKLGFNFKRSDSMSWFCAVVIPTPSVSLSCFPIYIHDTLSIMVHLL